MKALFLLTTEWSDRLLKNVFPKMSPDEIFLFSKSTDMNSIPAIDVVVTAAPHYEWDEKVIKKLQVPSLFVVEGLNNHQYIKGSYVDKVAVWGKNMLNDFVSMGWNKDRIVVTGCPRFKTHKRRVLIALPAYSKEELDAERFIYAIRTGLESMSVRVDVKRHPGVSGGLGSKEDLVDFLYNCEVVITGASTVAIQALFMNKKVIFVDSLANLFARKIHFKPLLEMGVKICHSVEEIRKELKHSEFIENYLYDTYNADMNIISLIREMANEHNNRTS